MIISVALLYLLTVSSLRCRGQTHHTHDMKEAKFDTAVLRVCFFGGGGGRAVLFCAVCGFLSALPNDV